MLPIAEQLRQPNDCSYPTGGAASGIGKATALLLASRGANLALADVRQDALNEAINEIQTEHPSTKLVSSVVDVAKSDEVANWLDKAVKQLGKFDGAANLAGITGSQGIKTIAQLDDQEWDAVMDVNLRGTFNCLRAEIGRMNDNGSIVNASSIAGLRGSKAFAPYVTSKHAVIGLTRVAAKEVCERGIKVNAIAP
ncbi:uncharacterized protein KY384_008403 [Bacidia gigantensis]|uniref:uncharacterized protein n=1 Tax=Bacidia gigantensis TaxID=2732470 RepID=UPI001D03ED8B|nr:uncharacterized protein KY384_008403 [Bacidia gigantensis]KAG8526974.1 hypothetical protein KY384_008403 [Bacidia gigantensis]